MALRFRGRSRYVVVVMLIAVAAILLVVAFWFNPRLTKYVEGDGFRAEMEKETAKGLHFPGGHYEPIKRTGMWTAETARFQASGGWKAMRSLDARGISASFKPSGVFRRLWQLGDVHIQSGQVEIQVYEPHPEPSPAKSWLAKYVLPDRVYLNHVEADTADVTWRFREKRAGIFGTRLLITPHGRDFEYQAREGAFRMDPFAEMRVDHMHLLITHELFTLYNMDLAAGSEGRIHAEGKSGTQPNDHKVDFRFTTQQLPLGNVMPSDWRDHLAGLVTSKIHWTGEDTKLEHSAGEAEFTMEKARIHDLPFLEKIASLANDPSLRELRLDICEFGAQWTYPTIDIKRCVVEEKQKFRAEGEVALNREGSLRGTIELGVAPALLAFLTAPVVKEVFPRDQAGYVWTTVHLAGTLKQPQLDLNDRLTEAIKEHPTVALKLLFRQMGDSFRGIFGEK